MNVFRVLSLTLALCFGLQALPVSAEVAKHEGSGDPSYQIQNPPAFAMMGDLLIARPLLIVATVVGAALFVVALPFTVPSGSVKDAGQALVVDPGKSAFYRCLGCTSTGYNQRD